MRGRIPVGPELAEQLAGSELACRRMRVILQTLAGTLRVKEACEELEICEQRFEAIRTRAIAAGIASLERRPAGRPPGWRWESSAEVTQLKERVEQLEAELEAARVSAELASHGSRVGSGVAKKSRPRSNHAKESNRSRPGKAAKTTSQNTSR